MKPSKDNTPAKPISTALHKAEADLARRVLLAESQAVADVAKHLGSAFHTAIDLIAKCAEAEGNVLVAGLGKSGLIGAKISATLTSLGISSHFVHPTEAAHGDLGNFRSDDVCIALSYSGQTDEVIALAATLKQDGIPVIAITSGVHDSGLSHVATVVLPIGDCEAKHALSPAPTVSTTATLALGDALALCVAARLRMTDDDFAKRHPGGALGGRMKPVTEALRFVVGQNLNPVPATITIAQALAQSEVPGRRPGAILVVDARGVLAGLFTDGDLRRLVLKDPSLINEPIAKYMTKNPATLPGTARVQDAERMIRENRRDEIPIVDERGKPLGLLDVQDLIAMRVVKE